LLFILMVAGCANREGEAALPTLAATRDTTIDPVLATAELPDLSPRATPNPAVPPTWTPVVAPPTSEATIVPLATNSGAGNAPTATAATTAESYVVQEGDTLGEIAERFGVTVAALAEANGLTDVDHIEAGQVLIIP
jgi:nucleoid-associated protein YgaU